MSKKFYVGRNSVTEGAHFGRNAAAEGGYSCLEPLKSGRHIRAFRNLRQVLQFLYFLVDVGTRSNNSLKTLVEYRKVGGAGRGGRHLIIG